MVDLETELVAAALIASSINSLLTTITLFHQVNEKMKVVHALQTVTSVLVTVVKKTPHPRLKRKHESTPIATAGRVRRRK